MINTRVLGLPENLQTAIVQQLHEHPEWKRRALTISDTYRDQRTFGKDRMVHTPEDVAGYLAVRFPSTYAQIYGALLQIKELFPHWQPTTILDMGSGPGTALFPAKDIWPTLTNAVLVERERSFIQSGKTLCSALPDLQTTWLEGDIAHSFLPSHQTFDLVIIANVLNEVRMNERQRILRRAYEHCKGIVIVLEPGTSLGNNCIDAAAGYLIQYGDLVAPYALKSYVPIRDTWIHFTQKVKRPLFQRTIRQQQREAVMQASDWEEAKYAYVACSKIAPEVVPAARVLGKPKLLKGYLEIPLLTDKEIHVHKVLKREKERYAYLKGLRWGDIITDKNLLYTPNIQVSK